MGDRFAAALAGDLLPLRTRSDSYALALGVAGVF